MLKQINEIKLNQHSTAGVVSLFYSWCQLNEMSLHMVDTTRLTACFLNVEVFLVEDAV